MEHVQKRVPVRRKRSAVDEDENEGTNRREAAEDPVDVCDPTNPSLSVEQSKHSKSDSDLSNAGRYVVEDLEVNRVFACPHQLKRIQFSVWAR